MGRNNQTFRTLFTSRSEEYSTPSEFFGKLDEEFHFTLDPCASYSNHKCSEWFSKAEDGLNRSWARHRVFMNPPYGRKIHLWMKKAYEESLAGTLVVALVHARTDTVWFHEWVYGKAELRFVRGRLHFSGMTRAPFPSMLAIYGR